MEEIINGKVDEFQRWLIANTGLLSDDEFIAVLKAISKDCEQRVIGVEKEKIERKGG